MKPGWRTTELTVVSLLGTAIGLIASTDPETVGEGVSRAAGCLSLGLVAAAYCLARAWTKRG